MALLTLGTRAGRPDASATGRPTSPRTERQLAVAQGIGFSATGIWPLLHMRSFVAVTGPKTDLWLVRTVGVLVTAIGGALALAGVTDRLTPEIRALAAASSASLAAVDVVYATRGRISKVYLLDALAEIPLAAFWVRSLLSTPSRLPRASTDGPA